MLKSNTNNHTIEALSPWNTKQNDQIGSIFPQIHKAKRKNIKNKQNKQNHTKTKHKKLRNNQSQPSFILTQRKQQNLINNINNNIGIKNKQNKENIYYNEKLIDNQNSFNFIKKTKCLKKQVQKRQVLSVKPQQSQRKYLQSFNYGYIDDSQHKKSQIMPVSNNNNNNDYKFIQQIKNTPDFKRQPRLRDVHSLYLIERLRGISQGKSLINDDQYKKRNKQFTAYKMQRKILTQRVNNNNNIRIPNIKTQGGCDSSRQPPLFSIKKSIKSHSKNKLYNNNKQSYYTQRRRQMSYKSGDESSRQRIHLFNTKVLVDRRKSELEKIKQQRNKINNIDNNNNGRNIMQLIERQQIELTRQKMITQDNDDYNTYNDKYVESQFNKMKMSNLFDSNNNNNQTQLIGKAAVKRDMQQSDDRQRSKLLFSCIKTDQNNELPNLLMCELNKFSGKNTKNSQSLYDGVDIKRQKEIKKYLRQLRCFIVKRKKEQHL